MSYRSTALRSILTSALLLVLMFFAFYLLGNDSPKPPVVPPPASIARADQSKKKSATRPPRSRERDEDFLEEILAYLPKGSSEETILFNGKALIHVKGASISEDPDTGIVSVKGLEQVELSTGVIVKTSADGVLSFDPTTGKTEITGLSVSMTTSQANEPVSE